MKVARFFKKTVQGRRVCEVIISGMQMSEGHVTIPVSGKAEARKVAAEHGATPRNF